MPATEIEPRDCYETLDRVLNLRHRQHQFRMRHEADRIVSIALPVVVLAS